MIVKGDIQEAFSHLVGLGIALIVEDQSSRNIGIRWLDQDHLEIQGVDGDEAAEFVKSHVEKNLKGGDGEELPWLTMKSKNAGKSAAYLNPRIPQNQDVAQFLANRQQIIDEIDLRELLSQRLIGSLGQSAYWNDSMKKEDLDRGASPWEMVCPTGSEKFVKRLYDVGRYVAGRSGGQVSEGLSGAACKDELQQSKKKPLDTSRTAAGLRAPGLTDNAQAWCALWALSAFPTRPVSADGRYIYSNTVGAGRSNNTVWFYLPVFSSRAVTPGRFRAVLRSTSLIRMAQESQAVSLCLSKPVSHSVSQEKSIEWLNQHGCDGVYVFCRHNQPCGQVTEHWITSGFFSSFANSSG